MEPLRVMMVPLHSRVGDIEGNLAKMLNRCDEAEGDGADLVCFPELSLTGYAMPHSRGLAIPDDHPALASVSERTEGSDLSICFGYVDSLYVSAWESGESVFAIVLGIIFLGQIPEGWEIVGCAVVVTGLLYYNYHTGIAEKEALKNQGGRK